MGALADEYVRVRADTSYMGRDLKKQGAASGKSFGGSFSGALKAVFASAAVIGAAKLLAGGLKTAVMAASDMNETANKSRIIFGKLSPVVTKFASTAAKDLGLTKQQALEAASSFGDMFTQIGFTGKEVTRMSLNVVRLSADLGSFNNLPTEDVQNRIAAAFRGEYDSLQALVPTINAATVQQRAMDDTGKKNAKSLTAQEKASATLAIVMESTKRAAGDFERTQGGLANQIKIAKAQLGDMAAEIGQSLLPSLSKLFGYITENIIPAFQDFFDNLSKDKALKTAVQNLKDALVTLTGDVDFKATLDSIAKALPPIVQGLADVVTKYKEIADAIDKFENMSFGGGDKVGGPVGQIIKDFGPGGTIETALIHFRTAAPAFIKQGWADVKAAFTADVISPLVRTFGPGGTIETALTHFRTAAAEKIRQAWTEIKSLFAAGWAAVKAGVSVAIAAIASALKAAVDAWTLPIRVAMTAIGTIMVLAWMAIRKPVLAAFTYIRDRIIKPYWAAIVDLFRSAMATIRAAWTAFWNAVKTTSAAAWEAVRANLAAVWARIRSAWTAAQTAVRTAWTTFWNTVKTAASAAWEAVRANLAAVWARVKGLFTSNQTAVKSSWSGFWTSIKTTASTAINAVRTSVTTVLGRIRDAFRTTVGNIKTIWAGVKTAVSAPVEWIKNNVYNKPLVPVWNKVASLVSGPKLSAYAQGGEIRGPRHGRDNVLGISRSGGATAMVEPGEWIAPRWMSSLFPQLESIRKRGRAALRDVGDPKRLPGFQGGGLVGWAKGLASNVSSKVGSFKDWALGGLRAAAAKILDPVKGLIGKAMPSSGVGTTVGGIGKKLIDLILDKIKSSDAAAMPALGGPAGSAIASGGWASIYRVLRAAGARSFTTYAGHDQGASRSRDIWPPSQAVAEAARRLSSIWYVIYNRRIASVTYGMRWRPYTRSNPHTDHVHVTLKPGVKAAMGGMAPMGAGLMNGGLIKGGRGGVLAHIGEGRRDELVTPLPRNWQRQTATPAAVKRPITILIDLGDGLVQRVQGLIDENDEFRATVGRTR